MFLSIAAAVLSGVAYAVYLYQVYAGGSVPNPASWTVWAFLAGLNAITFWRGSKDGLATAQFFIGAVGCFGVWAFALGMGKFAPLDLMAWIVLIPASLHVWFGGRRRALYMQTSSSPVPLRYRSSQPSWVFGRTERSNNRFHGICGRWRSRLPRSIYSNAPTGRSHAGGF